MARLNVGNVMPDFVFDTPFAEGCRLSETVKKTEGKTAVVFLRYFGCTLCQYDMHLYAENHEKIRETGGQLLVVLQSDPKKLADELKESPLPFKIICDPEQKLYKELEIEPAESKEKMVDLEAVKKIGLAKIAGFKHGDYEGEELQLPAAFIMDKDRVLTYAHYGKSVSDVLTPEKLVKLLI